MGGLVFLTVCVSKVDVPQHCIYTLTRCTIMNHLPKGWRGLASSYGIGQLLDASTPPTVP